MAVTVVLVKIHGIGSQKSTWSADFDTALGQRLATLPPAQQAQVVNESVWWADLSVLPGMAAPAAVAAPAGTGSVTYQLAYQQYLQYLAPSDAASGATAGLGLPSLDWANTIVHKLKDVTVTAGDQANDVANYVSDNGIRLKILNRLSDKLFEVHTKYPEAAVILGSHSQGTIISYDVLRLNDAQFPRLKVWVTMGCPLGWYLFARWGGEPLAIQPALTWLNFFDPQDKVGQGLAGLVHWPAPVPQDVDVQNVAHGLDPHDHWHNPDVVERYFTLIQGLLV